MKPIETERLKGLNQDGRNGNSHKTQGIPMHMQATDYTVHFVQSYRSHQAGLVHLRSSDGSLLECVMKP